MWLTNNEPSFLWSTIQMNKIYTQQIGAYIWSSTSLIFQPDCAA